ncbi:MAG: response regulator transcription factor [Limisphaerales bacterium]
MAIGVIGVNAMDDEAIGKDCQKHSSLRLLAPREREVLDLLSKGRAYKHIAAEMELSMGTVRTYIRRLYGKLNVNCRTDAVVIYITQPING